MVRHDGQVRLCDQKTLWIKMAASARDQIDRWLIVIGVVVEDSRWSSNDGGESHKELGMLMEMSRGFLLRQAVSWAHGVARYC